MYQRYVIVWTFLLIGWLSSLMLVVGPALGSSELTHPVNVVAFGGGRSNPCYRCSMVAWASFPVYGRVVTTDLRGLSQSATFYRPGIAIVYDSDAPTIAMARADYEAGKDRFGLGRSPPVNRALWAWHVVPCASQRTADGLPVAESLPFVCCRTRPLPPAPAHHPALRGQAASFTRQWTSSSLKAVPGRAKVAD